MIRGGVVVLSLLLAAGCGGDGPREIAWGRDECSACRMQIADPRFAAQLVTTRGKAFSFDAVECLMDFLGRERLSPDDVGSLWVADAARPGTLVDARTARYLRSPAVRSPMGLGVLAFGADEELAAARVRTPGEVLTWEQLSALRREAGTPTRPMPGAGAALDR